jgi:two-component system sensor histidine kinase CpxA
MSWFALRVFLLVWAIVILAVVLTILVSGWLPPADHPGEEWPYDHRPYLRVMVQPGSRLLLIGISFLLSAVGSIVLARFVIRPVRRLREAGRQVAEGDLTARVAPTVGSRRDDIAELARDFDVMTERVQALLESQQRLMRDVSHELRSPLARLQALLSIARQTLDRSERVPLDRMERELERVDELIGEILSYARLDAKEGIDRRPTDLVDLVQNIVDDADVEGQESGKRIRLYGPATCMLDADGGLIQRAIENVVRNALKHTAANTTVEVAITEGPASVEIVIRDRGPGVPEDALDKLFEPFYRVEDARGTHSGSGGIGLAIAERSVRLHGGTIRAANGRDGGLCIEIVLPC